MDAPFDTAVLAAEVNETQIWVGGPGGGPRVRVEVGETVVADFFAFEHSFRGGCLIAFDDDNDDLYVGPGVGGGLIEARYDVAQPLANGGLVELSRQWRGQPDDLVPGQVNLRTGWRPFIPPHPRDFGIMPLGQSVEFPTDYYGNTAVNAELMYIPRWVQQRLLDAGVTIVVHSGNVTDLFGGDPNQLTQIEGDGERTWRTVWSWYSGGVVYTNPAAGATVHELGHAVWDRVLSPMARAWYEADWLTNPPALQYARLSLTEAFAIDFYNWCYFGTDPRGFFRDIAFA